MQVSLVCWRCVRIGDEWVLSDARREPGTSAIPQRFLATLAPVLSMPTYVVATLKHQPTLLFLYKQRSINQHDHCPFIVANKDADDEAVAGGEDGGAVPAFVEGDAGVDQPTGVGGR